MGAGLVIWSASSLLLMLAARVWPLGWEETAVPISLPVAALGPFLAGLARPLPTDLVARAADRDLNAADRLGTAAGFDEERRVALERAQAMEAARYAQAHGHRQAAPLRVPERRLLVATVLALAVLALAVFDNPMDAVLERRVAENELLEEAAAEIERGAREVEAAPISEQEKKELVEELDRLAQELQDAPSIEEALQELLDAQRRLAALQQGDHVAAKTLTRSFERSLEDNPLAPGLSGSAAEQLAQLAAQMNELSQAERSEASERLSQLSESLQGIDPGLAAAMQAASSALAEAGDPRAVAAAAEALTAAQAGMAAQEAVAATSASLGALGEQLAAAQSALAQGASPGPGQGAGQGPGEGQGQGQGSGQGGQNQGQGVGAGGAGGTNANNAQGATGGAAQPDGTGNNASRSTGDAPVYDPIFGRDVADRLRVSGTNQGGRDTELGTQIGAGTDGEILIPYSFVYPEWSARAARSVDTLAIPASLRSFVRAYFRSLAPKEGR